MMKRPCQFCDNEEDRIELVQHRRAWQGLHKLVLSEAKGNPMLLKMLGWVDAMRPQEGPGVKIHTQPVD